MTTKQYRQVENIRNVIYNLRLQLMHNDTARQHLFDAEQCLEKLLTTQVPQK